MSEVLFTARPTPTRRPLLLTVALVVFFTLWHTVGAMFGASAATASTISGVVFEDRDRDGVADPGEPRWEGKGIWVFTPDKSAFVAGGQTDSEGRYEVGGLAPGQYLVTYHPTSWKQVKEDWVPTTTSGVWPERVMAVEGSATFDLGWRPVTTSTTEPLSVHTADSGMVVESYTDAVSADGVHDALASGSLHGGEEEATTVRFGVPNRGSSCATSVGGSPGTYRGFSATCWVSYDKWLSTRHDSLFHEYGHAWAQYHRLVVHQWEDWKPYLLARGIDLEDPRLGTSHAWTPGEMIAEDYRQLFGSDDARSWPQENSDVPSASEVDGLQAWLADTFGTSSSATSEESTTEETTPEEESVSEEPTEDEATSEEDLASEEPATDDTADTTTDTGTGDTARTEDAPDGPAVVALTGRTVNDGRTWAAIATVQVEDAEQPVPGLEVHLRWDANGHKQAGGGTVTCVTDRQGRCSASVDVRKNRDAVTFTPASLATIESAAALTLAKP